MKAPKEPKAFKRPRLYLQIAYNGYSSRIRIIYPDGHSEYMQNHYWESGARNPCWAYNVVKSRDYFDGQYMSGRYGKHRNPQDALLAMRLYDFTECLPPAEFLGEL